MEIISANKRRKNVGEIDKQPVSSQFPVHGPVPKKGFHAGMQGQKVRHLPSLGHRDLCLPMGLPMGQTDVEDPPVTDMLYRKRHQRLEKQ